MINMQSQPALPRCSLDRLTPIEPGLVMLAFLGINGHGSASRDLAEKTLAPLMPTPIIFGAALSALADDGLITVARSGRCRIMMSGRKQAEDTLGPLLGRAWSDIVTRSLVALALGLEPGDEETRRYLARRDNLECAALACLYGFATADNLPPRAEVRFLFLRALVSARLPECEAAFTEITMQNTLRDPVSRALMLGAAGLQRGSLREAEGALLRKALDVRGEGATAIADALVRNAVGKCVARPVPRTSLPPLTLAQPKALAVAAAAPEKADLADFAATVRDLARTQTTHPFAGRVAIAQVYDAGLQRGLDFGTLEGFKQRIAEAGRAGLLDLERYDIAGPMDASLRDRSRTPFGRDVRHFIVNEWI
jgi:hypothetical protein